jgi:hypothetical protein
MVYEVNPVAGAWRSVDSLPEGYRNGWLCFESEAEKRRLMPLPTGWQELPSEQLGNLLVDAVQVRRAIEYGR